MFLGEYSKWKRGDRLGPLTKALKYNEIDFSGAPISVFAEKLYILKFVYTCWPFRSVTFIFSC